MTDRFDDAAFTARLQAAVYALDETNVAVAARCGVTNQALGSWLSGQRVPNAASLAALCAGLGIGADWLLGLEGE